MLNSKLSKYLFKNFICHTVDTSVDVIKELPIPTIYKENKKVDTLVNLIKTKQLSDQYYDYMTNEQIEIDQEVYELYNLNKEDIQEVENGYFRRYPKLARVIEEKIKAKTQAAEK